VSSQPATTQSVYTLPLLCQSSALMSAATELLQSSVSVPAVDVQPCSVQSAWMSPAVVHSATTQPGLVHPLDAQTACTQPPLLQSSSMPITGVHCAARLYPAFTHPVCAYLHGGHTACQC